MRASTKRMAPDKGGRSRSSKGGLISLFNRYYSMMLEKKINEFRLRERDLKIYIRRRGTEKSEKTAEDAEKEKGGKFIRAPLTGIFYASASPNTSAYMTPPCEVKKGDILCVIEAMKVMNEIESPDDGRVLKTIPKNAELVTKDDPLFEIE